MKSRTRSRHCPIQAGGANWNSLAPCGSADGGVQRRRRSSPRAGHARLVQSARSGHEDRGLTIPQSTRPLPVSCPRRGRQEIARSASHPRAEAGQRGPHRARQQHQRRSPRCAARPRTSGRDRAPCGTISPASIPAESGARHPTIRRASMRKLLGKFRSCAANPGRLHPTNQATGLRPRRDP